MKITLKLFSSLMEYLPNDVEDNSVILTVGDSTTPYDLLDRYGIPREEAQVIMKNGAFCPVDDRSASVNDGDVLSVWPSIQGG